MKKYLDVSIFCPQCGRYLMKVSERATTTLQVKCKKCEKLVVYDGEKQQVSMSKMRDDRISVSGLKFW